MSARRRLWGGEYSKFNVGTTLRPFGGYNYGYALPQKLIGLATGNENLNIDGAMSVMKNVHSQSWAQFAATLVAVLSVTSVPTTLAIVAMGVVLSEAMASLTRWQMERLIAGGADTAPLEATYIHQGQVGSEFKFQGVGDILRNTSGISVAFNVLAGFAMHHRAKGWVPWIAGMGTIGTNLYSQYNSGVSADSSHWGGFYVGWLLGWILPGGRGGAISPGKDLIMSLLSIAAAIAVGWCTVYIFPTTRPA